ncbi:MAG: hypothetical protein JNL70_24980 [Saprospiraceae bacterium]|nr:hypothetical protein [Saprospiraceae bacterium]
MFSRRQLPFQVFTLTFVAAMFFPRVLPEGMFPDGLTYAAIARNMAAGQGGFWSPYFSSSFWLSFEGNQYEFFGHPTLAMGILSLFFKVFGDHWFIEKGYAILIWVITVGLIVRLWRTEAIDKGLWWLPVFLWYVMPTVLWSYPQFMLDNTMTVFSLLASLTILRGMEWSMVDTRQAFGYFVVAGLFLHLAFLSKGPVGLFPLAMPLGFWLVYRDKMTGAKALGQIMAVGATCFGTLALWYFYEPARLFWSKYFEIQLVSSISSNSQSIHYDWYDYFYIPIRLVMECAPFLGVLLILFVFAKAKSSRFTFQKAANRRAAFYLWVGLSGSLPMMISHKTSAFYLVPCLPFFALSLAAWLEPSFVAWSEKHVLTSAKMQKVRAGLLILALGVVVYSLLQIGTIGREKDIIRGMTILSKEKNGIRDGEKIAVCDATMNDFNYHAYFQRYHRWELAKVSDTTARYFIHTEGSCRITELDSAAQRFIKKNIAGLEKLQFYEIK